MPMRPPRSDRVSASTRNWARMSRPRAPMALRMPISRVRSRTETSMMFMIPMPPTTSEIEAIPPSSRVSVALIEDAASSSWVWLKTLKSAVSVAARSWRSRSSAVIAALRRGHLVRVGDAHADRPDGVAADEVLLRRRRSARGPGRRDPGSRSRPWPGGCRSTWNGRPPTEICVPRSLGAEPEVRRGRGAEDGDAQVVGRGSGRSGTCPARRRRRGPSGRPGSCRRPWSSCSWCRR